MYNGVYYEELYKILLGCEWKRIKNKNGETLNLSVSHSVSHVNSTERTLYVFFNIAMERDNKEIYYSDSFTMDKLTGVISNLYQTCDVFHVIMSSFFDFEILSLYQILCLKQIL
jgi:hypothetical protein